MQHHVNNLEEDVYQLGDLINKARLTSKLQVKKHRLIQGLTNCAHSDERAHNVHAKRFSRARNYIHVNQSKSYNQII